MSAKRLVQTAKIRDGQGLHVRPASQIVKLCNESGCLISLSAQGRIASGKSLVEILMLEAASGDEVTISVEGTESEVIMSQVIKLLDAEYEERG